MTQTASGLLIQQVAGIHIVEFIDNNILDQIQVERIRVDLEHLVETAGTPRLVLNFQRVNLVSSALLGVLMTLDRKTRAKSGAIRLANINNNVRQVFAITRLERILGIFPSTDAAIENF